MNDIIEMFLFWKVALNNTRNSKNFFQPLLLKIKEIINICKIDMCLK